VELFEDFSLIRIDISPRLDDSSHHVSSLFLLENFDPEGQMMCHSRRTCLAEWMDGGVLRHIH
jgi:hypothetical protein